jgi:hypothetical protein
LGSRVMDASDSIDRIYRPHLRLDWGHLRTGCPRCLLPVRQPVLQAIRFVIHQTPLTLIRRSNTITPRLIRFKATTAAGVLHVELTSSSSAGSFPNADDYTLPLGSAALDDGQVVLETLRRQRKSRKNSYRILPKDTLFRGLADSPSAILSVKMEMLASSNSLPGSFLHWSSSPTPLIRKLCGSPPSFLNPFSIH